MYVQLYNTYYIATMVIIIIITSLLVSLESTVASVSLSKIGCSRCVH